MNNTLDILLNKSVPFEGDKILMLDQVSAALQSQSPSEIQIANDIWKVLAEDPNFWMSSAQIMQNSQNPRTKVLTLIVLQTGIKQKWLALPAAERDGIRSFIVGLVVSLGGVPNLSKEHETILTKANSILVQIVKYEWSSSWTNFISDICSSCQNNINLCQNNLKILKMLSEEIFDFSKNQMTKAQINQLKQHMHKDFTEIYNLCDSIIQNADKLPPSLSKAGLQTFYAFLSWIPIYYIFFSGTIEKISQFLISQQHRQPALRCLVEIAGLNVNQADSKTDQVKTKLFILLKDCIVKFGQLIPISDNIDCIKNFKEKSDSQALEITCQNIARFLTTILQEQWVWLVQQGSSNPAAAEQIKKVLMWLVRLMQPSYDQTYRMIVEFFHFCAKKVKEFKSTAAKPLLYTRDSMPELFASAFEDVKKTIILRMMKPQEVLIVIDESGCPVREEISDTQNNNFYELMKELLINLAQFNWATTKSFIVTKIQRQSKDQLKEFSFDTLNSLSWAVGSMNGFIPQQQEKSFMITVIRTLLQLCQMKKGKENKAVVASCIMYVVGQYPNFLRSNWTFLKTVVRKLFEFMKEKFPGVMDMACNTFLKIAQSTGQQFVKLQETQQEPYIYELIRKTPEETCDLTSQSLKLIFYEAVGHIIAMEEHLNTKTLLMKNLLGGLLQEYESILKTAETNPEVLKLEEIEKKIVFFLKINERLAYSVGLGYGALLVGISSSLNQLFGYYMGETCRFLASQQGLKQLNFMTVKRMRYICKEILKLYSTYISKCDKLQIQQVNSVIESFVIPLVQLLIDSYSKCIPEVREAEFLVLLTHIFQKLNAGLQHDLVMTILKTVFESTLGLIIQDFKSYPQIRAAFFLFLKSIIRFNFQQLYSMPQDTFKTILDCIIWSIKHDLSTFSDLGLELLHETLLNLGKNINTMNIFYCKYYILILKEILEVLTDGFHKSGFKMQCKVLYIMFRGVTNSYLTMRLGGDSQTVSNAEFVYAYMLDILSSTFPNVSRADTSKKLQLIMSAGDEKSMKEEVSDYLVMINRYTMEERQEIQNAAG